MNLMKMFKRKGPELCEFDQLVKVVGSDTISIWNGATYSGERSDTDGNYDKFPFDCDRWFKIRIGKFISGPGDWGFGYEYASSAVAEVYIDPYGRILHICAVHPFYNSPTMAKDEQMHKKVQEFVDGYNARHPENDKGASVMTTQNMWLRGALDVLTSFGQYSLVHDFWKHSLTVNKPDVRSAK